jgi:ribbon-helix-helix CopG family protein
MSYANIYAMKRTTIYVDPELEVLLKRESIRRGKPAAELIRDAVRAYLSEDPAKLPPGAGAFRSGRKETAERAEEILAKTGFGKHK